LEKGKHLCPLWGLGLKIALFFNNVFTPFIIEKEKEFAMTKTAIVTTNRKLN
jgi:hypothetical protein